MEWKSEKKLFEHWDREQEKNVATKLPFKFLTLMELHTVKGWHDNSESGIYANEVKFIGQEELTVKSFKGGLIAKGLYKEIKDDVKNAGGHYTKSVYVMLEDGSIANIQMKGSVVKEWGDFTQKTRSRLPDEWVIIKDFESRKKGRIEFTVPTFQFDKSLNAKAGKLADESYGILEEYMKVYKGSDNTPEAKPVTDDEDYIPNQVPDNNVDDLDF